MISYLGENYFGAKIGFRAKIDRGWQPPPPPAPDDAPIRVKRGRGLSNFANIMLTNVCWVFFAAHLVLKSGKFGPSNIP